MTCDTSFHLLCDLNYDLDRGETAPTFRVGNLCFKPEEISSSSRAKAMYQFLKEKGNDYEFLRLDLTHSPHDHSHVLDIKQPVVNFLYNNFPEPFIRIWIQDKTPLYSKITRLLLDERLPLEARRSHEWAYDASSEEDEWLGYQNRQFSTLKGFEGSFAINVMVKWEEPTIKSYPVIRKLLHDDSSKDLTLVAGNGAEFKCHKSILAVHAKSFSAMLSVKTGMMEATSGRIEMRENTEDGIRNLLRYMYGIKLTMVDIPKDVTIELFQTAHKYGIVDLEDFLQEYLMSLPVSWFGPDTLLELYLYVKHLEVLRKLREHLLYLMASMNSERLKSCQIFSKLNPTISLDLSFKLVEYFQRNVERVPKPKNHEDDDDEESEEDGEEQSSAKRRRQN